MDDRQNERGRPHDTTAARQISPATGKRDLIAFGPIDEIEPRIEATITNLSAALMNEIEIIVAVEAAIVQLEKCARYLKVVRR